MENGPKPSFLKQLKILVIGGARSPSDPHIFHKLSLIAFFAWVGLGADGISSSSYGPEEAFRTLGGYGDLAIFIAVAAAITIFVISAGYSQIVELFPSGGGGYVVASKLLGPHFGMISGSALLIDYVMTITVSIASGADAIFSFLPMSWLPFKIHLAVAGVLILTILNLRGVKESVVPLIPIFLTFMITHVIVIVYSVMVHVDTIPIVVERVATEVGNAGTNLGFFGLMILLMRSYSMGAGTFTGIEAVSNGIPILREPRVQTAKTTMRYMAVSLAAMVVGLMVAYIFFRVEPIEGKTLNAVLLHSMTAGWGKDFGYVFVLVTLASEAALLFVAAQTGFLGGPRVLANMAMDRWFPTKFSMLSDRLVTQNGVLLMGGAALIMMLLTNGSVRFLVVLYSINVFITFTLSMLGLVKHWIQERGKEKKWKKKLTVSGFGLFLTSFILVSVVIVKFHEGGWITLLITSLLVASALIVKNHYKKTMVLLGRLDSLVEATTFETHPKGSGVGVKFDPTTGTAVILVNGFNGLGLHTLFGVNRLFRGQFKNFVFIQVGVVDAGIFKGSEEIDALKQKIDEDTERYVKYIRSQGFFAEKFTGIGTDIITEVMDLIPQVLKKFPQAIFFGGQLVFPENFRMARWLHNYIVFALQRRFYQKGIPFVILPIRV